MVVNNPRNLAISVLTVSDTRNEKTDKSGQYLTESIKEAGHDLFEKVIAKDDIYAIRAVISRWIADTAVNAIITTGGTGFYPRDVTPEAISPLFDKPIEGFGELFRAISYQEIGTSTIQSRVFGAWQTVLAYFVYLVHKMPVKLVGKKLFRNSSIHEPSPVTL